MAIPPDLRRDFRKILLWGLVVFLVVNAFSWSPGWGGRNDGRPGREVERYFGWPACFRAELWRSDHDHEVNVDAYIPPVPLSSEMYLVYSSNSLLALLLDAALAACGCGVCLLMKVAEHRDRSAPWMIGAGGIMIIVSIAIIAFGDRASTYL